MNSSNKTPIFIGIGVVAVAVLAWLAFGFFGIQTAFIDNEVSESADDLFTAAPAEVEEEAPAEEAVEEEAPVEEEEVEEAVVEEEAVEATTTTVAPETTTTTEAPPEIVTTFSGTFGSLNDYSVSGDALVLSNGTDQRFLRFENFASDNGPDLKVYLRAANGDFVSLGDLTGNIGDQNYEIPPEVDLAVFNTVEIWCERFSAGFGAATLS